MRLLTIALLTLALFACKTEKSEPATGTKVGDDKPASDKQGAAVKPTPTPAAKTEPELEPTATGKLVSIFTDEGPGAALQLASGKLTARAKSDQAVELLWNGVVVTECSVNLAITGRVQAMHKDGHAYVVCEEDHDDYTIHKLKLGKTPSHVGWAGRAGELEVGKLHDLQYTAPGKKEMSAEELAQEWLELVAAGDKKAATLTQFPLAIRTTDAKPACDKSADALSFHDKALACLQKNVKPEGHTRWERSEVEIKRLTKLLSGQSGGFVRFESMGEGMTTYVVVMIGDTGRVSAVVYESEFFE